MLRGVRRTFEACNSVRSALESLGVTVCERDVSMDRGFREELKELMKGKGRQSLVPPRVFVKGRYIGGAEEVLKIAKEGLLGELLEGLPKKRTWGRMKLFGTIVYPKNRDLTLQLPRGGKNVMCEDCFDNMIVFSEAWWIGRQDENPVEVRLDFPRELTDGQHAEYDFKGGASGVTSYYKQHALKTGISHVEEQSQKPQVKDDLLDDDRDFMNATPL